jgi:hypothetical protein
MLLYRMPWRVLARSGSADGLDAVLMLARHLRVPVERRSDPGRYLAVGLMRPPGRIWSVVALEKANRSMARAAP